MAVVERLLCWGRALVAVAVVERFKQESMYGFSAMAKKVAVVERWPLVEVRLYNFKMVSNSKKLTPQH